MSQILTNFQPDDRLAHRITDAAVFAGLSRNASQLAVRYEPIVALRLDPQNPRLHKQVRQTDLKPYATRAYTRENASGRSPTESAHSASPIRF